MLGQTHVRRAFSRTHAARRLTPTNANVRAKGIAGSYPVVTARELGVMQRFVAVRQRDFARDTSILLTTEQWRVDTWAN